MIPPGRRLLRKPARSGGRWFDAREAAADIPAELEPIYVGVARGYHVFTVRVPEV
jgi:hypothetical protein